MDHDLNALLIFEDEEERGSVYEYVLVERERLSEAWEIARRTHNDWSYGDWRSTNVFEAIFKALDKAGIPYKSVVDWDTFRL